MLARIVNGTYIIRHGTNPLLVFWVRMENGEKRRIIFPSPIRPYFFVRVSDLDKVLRIIRSTTPEKDIWQVDSTGAVGVDGEKLAKISVYSPKLVGIARRNLDRRGITSYEGDIKFIRRAMIDLDIYAYLDISGGRVCPVKNGDVPLRVLYIDIEADDRHGFPKPERDRIISVAMVDDEGKEYFFMCEDNDESEKEMLLKVKEVIERYDVIVGWNSENFDQPYLEARWKKYGIDRAKSVTWLDMLKLYRFVSQRELKRYNLDYIASEVEGVGHKVEHTESIGELWMHNPQKLREYNLTDVWLMKRINDEGRYNRGIIQLAMAVAEVAGVFVNDITQVSLVVDTIILREAKRRRPRIVYKSKTSINEDKYTGAMVFEPKAGVHRYVAVLDLVSLYNRVIQTFNLSHETIVSGEKYDENKHLRTPTGLLIDKTRRGIIPSILERLEEDRNRFKRMRNKYEPGTPEYNYYDMNQWVRKIILLSFYGVLGFRGGRYYTRRLAETVTLTGRWVIKTTAEVLEENGFAVLYGDSVSGDTKVFVRRPSSDNGDMCEEQPIRIEDLFEKVDFVDPLTGKEYYFPQNLMVLSFDKKRGASVFKKVRYVMRHKTNKKMYRVWLTNEEYIDVTEDHSLIGYVNKRLRRKNGDAFVEVKPTEVGKVAKTLVGLKKIPRRTIRSRGYPRAVYEFLGFFVGDGSRNKRAKLRDGLKWYYYGVSAGNDVEDIVRLLEKLKTRGWVKNWSVRENGDIVVWGGKFVELVDETYDEAGRKRIPEFMFYETEENIKAFLRGLFGADGTIILKDGNPIIRLATVYKDLAFDVQKLLWFVGFGSSVYRGNTINRFIADGKVYGGKTHSYYVNVKEPLRFVEEIGFNVKRKEEKVEHVSVEASFYSEERGYVLKRVMRIEEIEYGGYVYDIEVDDTHVFFANGILVHNTDSVFFETGTQSLADAIMIGEDMKDMINKAYWERLDAMGVPEEWRRIEMKFEKVFSVVVFGDAKKRYAGMLVYNEGLTLSKPKLVIKGLETIRSDTTPFGEEVQLNTIRMVLEHLNNPEEHPISEVYDYLRRMYVELMEGRVKEKLVRYKGLSMGLDDYKSQQEHVRAAQILKMAFGTVPATRIGYLLLDKDGSKKAVIGAVYNGRVYFYATGDRIDSKTIDEVKITKRALRHYWQREVRAPLERILGGIINFDKVEIALGQTILDSFFK